MLKIGDSAPVFNLHDQNGKLVTLDQYKGKWLVLYFYPEDDTHSCTTEACSFSENLEKIEKLGATVVGISPDSPESHQKFIEKFSLKFPLLSDEKLEAIKSYEAWGVIKDKESVLRSTYLIDPNGMIKMIYRDVKVDTHFAELIQELENKI